MDTEANALVHQLMRTFRQFNKAIWHRRSLSGFKPSEIRVLFCIRRETRMNELGMTVSDISTNMHVTPPTITQLINGLEVAGLVEKKEDPVDRRVVRVRLTEKGERVAQTEIEQYHTSLNGLIQYLGETESEQLVELLHKVNVYYTEIEG